MKKIAWIIMAVAVGLYAYTTAQADDQTIYLIRHAEKVADGTRDPVLTDVGNKRAKTYAKYFADKNIKAIYSSNTQRTLQTAAPTAAANGLEIEMYNPGDLEAMADLAMDLGTTIVVVGHSNTTAVLANILMGGELPDLEDHHYDRVYIVVLKDDGTGSVRIEHVEPLTP